VTGRDEDWDIALTDCDGLEDDIYEVQSPDMAVAVSQGVADEDLGGSPCEDGRWLEPDEEQVQWGEAGGCLFPHGRPMGSVVTRTVQSVYQQQKTLLLTLGTTSVHVNVDGAQTTHNSQNGAF
jgi:hypothetical protein